MSEIRGDSSTVEQPIPIGDGGSTPTSSLQSFRVTACTRKEIQDFLVCWHYTHNLRGVQSKFCFSLVRQNELIGAMILADPAMWSVADSYGGKGNVIELRRLACIDDTPKNTESFFIGYVLRWLRKNTKYKTVLAYSDLEYGHIGVVYKASNFRFNGVSRGERRLVWNGKTYHSRALKVYKGRVRPFTQQLRDAETRGEVTRIYPKDKNIWTYNLRGRSEDAGTY